MTDKNENTDASPSTPDAEKGVEQKVVLVRQLLPPQLPVIPLFHRPLFPKMTVPLQVEDPGIRDLLLEVAKSDQRFVGLVLVRRRDPVQEAPAAVGAADLHDIGVVGEISHLVQPSEGVVQVILSAIERFRITSVIREKPHITVQAQYILETEMADNAELRAYSVELIKSIKDLIQLNPLHKEELGLFMAKSSLHEPGRLGDFAAALTTASGAELQDVLETVSIRERLRKSLALVRKEIDISRIQAKIGQQIDEKVSRQQREFFLREQLKAIKKELGLEKEGKEAEAEKFEERLRDLHLTPEAKERVDEELEKLRLLEPASPEFAVSRTYLDWLTILPWGVFTKDNYDIGAARTILDHDHYGLEDVKERILEFLSVGIRKGSIAGSILCFVGPPGVGKTSIGQSIARSIGRNFYRFSVGGIRDEAEIKGHRRTYIGALPGKLIQALKTCKSANPVLMLDEIDKIGASFQGDPASALLEVLDPEQNREFLDHYLDVRFDLSNIFFICTANQLDTIPRPLLDRMEVITLPGYILEEKLQIARRYLIPKQLAAHGLDRKMFAMSTGAIRTVIDGYAREPGVRSLEKHIRKIMRKAVKAVVEKKASSLRLEAADVERYLGKPVFSDDERELKPLPGVATGLAWTSMGGDVLNIEATRVETGTAGFKQTGQLGSVMVESSEIAYTYVRSYMGGDPKAKAFFSTSFIHLHVPAGATPKDGPSAGITMAAALYSLATGRPLRSRLAMTGELTLTGRVMPIGGVKEKTIAAKRVKLRNLVFPRGNRKDFEELPAHVRRGLKPHFVSTFDDVVKICFS